MPKIDFQSASRGDLLAAYFSSRPSMNAKDFPEANIAYCSAVVNEFDRRAVERNSLEWLRDSLTLGDDLARCIDGVRYAAKAHFEKTGLIVPPGAVPSHE